MFLPVLGALAKSAALFALLYLRERGLRAPDKPESPSVEGEDDVRAEVRGFFGSVFWREMTLAISNDPCASPIAINDVYSYGVSLRRST